VATTAQTWQDRILEEVGATLDADAGEGVDILTPIVGSIWDAWSWKSYGGPNLQYLYTKKQCIEILLGQHRRDTHAAMGAYNPDDKSMFDNLLELLRLTIEDIKTAERTAAGNRGGVVKAMLQTSPVMVDPNSNCPDPNDRKYRGDPIRRPGLLR
jgi:CO dehydrogenase/acetyl-CoA synthase alpha subunit